MCRLSSKVPERISVCNGNALMALKPEMMHGAALALERC